MSLIARKSAFPPSVDARTRVLMLGSLPGEASLAARQYYANPTNQFWPLIGGVIGVDLVSLPYEARLERLLAAGVGLWDTVRSATRVGSLDGAIRDHQANPLGAFVASLPDLKAIGFNGAKAAAVGKREIDAAVAFVDLPSSSAAYCSIPFAAKQAKWFALRDYLEGAPV